MYRKRWKIHENTKNKNKDKKMIMFWNYVLKICFGIMFWNYVLEICFGIMFWSYVWKFCMSTVEVTGSRERGDVRGSPLTAIMVLAKMSNKYVSRWRDMHNTYLWKFEAS